MHKNILIALISILMSGCAAQLLVESEPEGAYIIQIGTGKPFGMAPILLNYDLHTAEAKATKDASGCYVQPGLIARWVSGVEQKLDAVKLCSDAGTFHQQFVRDPNLPGLKEDLEFALKAKILRASEAAASASKAAANAAQQAARATKKNTQCTSVAVGSTIQRNCY